MKSVWTIVVDAMPVVAMAAAIALVPLLSAGLPTCSNQDGAEEPSN